MESCSIVFASPAKTCFCSFPSRDHLGNRTVHVREAFEVTVERPDASTFRINPHDSGDGRHTFRVHFATEGRHVISARHSGLSVRDSPFAIHAKSGMNYVARAASGSALLIFGKEGDKPGELCRPWGICCDSQVNIGKVACSPGRIR